MQEVINASRKHDLERIDLTMIAEQHTSVRTLYERLGFCEVDTVPQPEGYSLIQMTCKLK
jgi:hypothetical protein